MSTPPIPDRLQGLLPYVYRKRDAEGGRAMEALLRIVGEQAGILERDIAGLYDDWFIETCRDWVVPYIGELVGWQQVHDAGEPASVASFEGRLKNHALISRREVAHTVAYRRRKGSLALLELLGADVSGWPARAVEFYRLLGWTQHVRHVHPTRGRTVDLHDLDALERLGGPFEDIAHTVDVRRPSSRHAQGKHNVPSVGLFVFRLRAYSVTKTQAYCQEAAGHAGQNCFSFSILGNDIPLFARPRAEDDPAHIAEEVDLPVPIRRRALGARLDDYYGEGKSLSVWREDETTGELVMVPAREIVVADLSDWFYRARVGQVAVDPELGRIVFPAGHSPRGVCVSYHYGFSAGIGGGEYERVIPEAASLVKRYEVGSACTYSSIGRALEAWRSDTHQASVDGRPPPNGVIEIADSAVYSEAIGVALAAGQSLEIRAQNRARPVIRLLDYEPNAADALSVTGAEGSRFTLDGLLVMGRGLKVEGPLARIIVRHTTLVPGWALGRERGSRRPVEPALYLVDVEGPVRIERSILGPIRAGKRGEPLDISIRDSIVDALDDTQHAFSGIDPGFARTRLTVQRSTIFGGIRTHEIALAENSILFGLVEVARAQRGCVRFCYVPPGSRTPRRHACQPDRALEGIAASETALRNEAERSVVPAWTTTVFGQPGYAQLATTCPDAITGGADDESEMGVFHDLFSRQRAQSLRVRLSEYVPAGADAGVFYAT